MHDLFYVKIYRTKGENKYDCISTVELIADRKSAFSIWFDYKNQGYNHIDVRNCSTGETIDFSYGLWGETKPLEKKDD